jgi:hypothetical protein
MNENDLIDNSRASRVLRFLANRIIVVICSIACAFFFLIDSGWVYIQSLGKLCLVGIFAYVILFTFHQSGGRSITETYLFAFAIISLTYFSVAAPWRVFFAAMGLSFVLALCFQFLE